MKRLLKLGAASVMFLCLGSIQHLCGQVLMADNFDYPAGDSLTKHNWIQQQSNALNPIMVNNGGLTYTGYVGSGIGNSAALGTDGQDLFRGFVKQTQPGTLYLTCLAKVTAATTAGDFFISFKESATSPTNVNYRGRVWVKANASNNIAFGVTKGAMTAPMVPNYTGYSYSLNTTYLIVMKFTIVAGTVPNDSAQLFINPVIGSPEPSVASVICPDVNSGTDLGLGSVLLRQGTIGSSPNVIVDGIRVSKTWQSAIIVSNVSTLSDLQVDGTTLAGFVPGVFTYNDTVPFGQPSVVLNSTTSCVLATQVTNTATTIPGTSTVVVTAENGTTTSTYTITHGYFFYNVQVFAAPSGTGTVTGGGVLPGGIPTTVTATPNTDYLFVNWTEFGNVVSTNPVYIFTPFYSTDLVGNFAQAFLVTATASPAAGGTIAGAGQVPSGGTATLTATPASGYIFENWTENGNVIGSNPVLVLANITANHDVVGHFTLSANTFTVSASSNPPAAGVITGSGNVPAGGSITLTASQNWGYVFVNWTENSIVIGTSTSLTFINVQANHSVIANFRDVGVGVSEQNNNDTRVFPTISNDMFNVEASCPIGEILVFDMTGSLVHKQKTELNSAVISASLWNNGTFVIRIITADRVYTRRIIKADL